MAVASVPWKTEAEVYRSDLARRLPDGLTAPRALGVFDLDATSSSIWLEEVPARPATWDLPRYERAAYLLGRLSGSPALAPLAGLRHVEWSMNTYATGRLAVQVVPMLMSDEIWQHPLCAAFDDELRGPAARGGGRRDGAGRRGGRAALSCSATGTPAPTTCWPGAQTTTW